MNGKDPTMTSEIDVIPAPRPQGRWVTSSTPPVDGNDAQGPDESHDSPGVSRRTLITSGVLAGMGVLALVGTMAVSSVSSQVSEASQDGLRVAREKLASLTAERDGIPEVEDVKRGLVTAQQAAHDVADLQNDYRSLTPAVAKAQGKLSDDLASDTRRNLTPYFDPAVNSSVLSPWYLLKADTDAPVGAGIPMSFRSGFAWQAQTPFTITTKRLIPVQWLAVTTQEPRVTLAFARADYDLTRKIFTHVRTGTTTDGQAARQNVEGA